MDNFRVVLLGGPRHGEEVPYMGSRMHVPRTPSPGYEAHLGYAYDDYDYTEWIHRQGFYVLKDSLAKPTGENYRFTREFQSPSERARQRHG